MPKKIHIVSFDVPFPPNYGGIIDVYYKIKALHELGVKVYLHTYQYAKAEAKELNEICEKVYYYKKRNNPFHLLSSWPFSARSRKSKLLASRLQKSKAPQIYEGLKSTYALINGKISTEKVLIRSHNIEHEYFRGLAQSEKSNFKKIIYKKEAEKLERYQKVMQNATVILSISEHDHEYFNDKFANKSYHIPPFHANNEVRKLTGKGQYSLYHGDLRISDNLRAAHFLIDIFQTLKSPLIIAGGIEVKSILAKIKGYNHITFMLVNPEDDMTELIAKAHINVLPSFQKTGIKLKLINALFNGRFCLVNQEMIAGTGLEKLCQVARSMAEFRKQILELNKMDYTLEMYAERDRGLALFNNKANAQKIIDICT